MTTMLGSVIVIATAALASAGCGMTQPLVQVVNDSYMTTSIKTRLATDARVGTLTDVGVHTSDDMVHLTGTVADEAERRHVESIARSIAGDNRVVSELRVAGAAPASTRARTP
jgi:hyperosmotically inducible protein